MKLFEIIFESTTSESPEITSEHHFWTAPSLAAASIAASNHAYEYDVDFKSAKDAVSITRQISSDEMIKELERYKIYIDSEE